MAVFGNEASKEVIKVERSRGNGSLIQEDWYFYKKRHQRAPSLSLPCGGTARKRPFASQKERPLATNQPAGTLTLDF